MSLSKKTFCRVAGVVVVAPLAAMSLAGPAAADPPADHAPGLRSNLGLCSPYLGSLPAPVDPFTGETLGGNARSGVNLLIKLLGPMLPDHLDTPGELYRVRAHEHPDAPAEVECVPRPTP